MIDKKPWEFDAVNFLEAERRRSQQTTEFSRMLNKERDKIKDLSASVLPKRNYHLSYISFPSEVGAALSELTKRTGVIYTYSEMYLPNEDPRRQSAIDEINSALSCTRNLD